MCSVSLGIREVGNFSADVREATYFWPRPLVIDCAIGTCQLPIVCKDMDIQL